ncbi:MAG: WD40 repeat domain-containing protein [Anaerolineae bacterium]|nr:WD40 repeat domain-containing protein [Anaerolineae bacterium]
MATGERVLVHGLCIGLITNRLGVHSRIVTSCQQGMAMIASAGFRRIFACFSYTTAGRGTLMLRFTLHLLIMLLVITSAQAQSDVILYSLSYSPDGNYVAGVGKRALIFDAMTGDILADIDIPLQTSTSLLFNAAWSPDGNRLAVAGTDGRIRILDLSDDAEPFGALLAEFEVVTSLSVRSVAWSPDGSLLVIGGDGISPRLEFWDASTYELLWTSPYVIGAGRIAWHPAPQRNLIAMTDGSLLNGAKLVDISEGANGSPIWLCSSCAPDAVALPLAWNSTGTLLAIGHNDGSVFVVDVDTDTVVMSMQTAVGVSGLLWTHDDHYLISMSRAGLQVWDSVTGDLLYSPAEIEPRRIAMHPFNDQIFYFDRGAGVGVTIDISTLIEPSPLVLSITIPPTDGTILATPTVAAGSGGH